MRRIASSAVLRHPSINGFPACAWDAAINRLWFPVRRLTYTLLYALQYTPVSLTMPERFLIAGAVCLKRKLDKCEKKKRSLCCNLIDVCAVSRELREDHDAMEVNRREGIKSL